MAGVAGRSGRRRQSAAAHVLAGTFREDRAHAEPTPEAPVGRPPMPKPLTGDAADEWLAMAEDLERHKTLAVTDRQALYQYARLYAETEAVAAQVLALGEQIEGLNAALKQLTDADLLAGIQAVVKLHQVVSARESKVLAGRLAMRQFLIEFGMTPASRTRVKLPTGKPKSKIEQFMARQHA